MDSDGPRVEKRVNQVKTSEKQLFQTAARRRRQAALRRASSDMSISTNSPIASTA